MRITLFIFLVCLCCTFGASGCDYRVERPSDVLVQSISANPPTLNPIVASDVTSLRVSGYIYESLLERNNETLKLDPHLAERYEVSPDHLSYTFWMREGVKWQDGTPFTVDDVIFTFDAINNPKVDAARLRNYYRDVVSVKKVGDRAVRFVYSKPYFRALIMLGSQAILPKHIFDDVENMNTNPANRHPIGTGPYRFEEWTTGSSVRLTRFDGYWGEKPEIEGILYRVIPDTTVAFQLLKKGAIDLSGLRAVQWARQTESKSFADKFTKHRYYLPNTSFVAWNTKRVFFSDRRVRQAMTMLINRKAILEKILFGQGMIVSNDFYPLGINYDKSIEPYHYDPGKAKELLAEAGWTDSDGDGVLDKDGVAFEFSYLAPSSSDFAKSLGLFMREDLRKAGIVMEIQQLEWATMLKLLDERNYDAAQLAWSGQFEEDPYQVWHSSQIEKGSNFVGFGDPRIDRIVDEARREFDDDRRRKLYREMQRIVHVEQPYTFLFSSPSLVAVAGRFEDVVAYRTGVDLLEWKIGPWPKLMEW